MWCEGVALHQVTLKDCKAQKNQCLHVFVCLCVFYGLPRLRLINIQCSKPPPAPKYNTNFLVISQICHIFVI